MPGSFQSRSVFGIATAIAIAVGPATDARGDELDEFRVGQLKRLAYYTRDAIMPNGLVLDALPYSPDDDPFHPATPDAAGFALLALCAADSLGLSAEAEALTERILAAYAGEVEGVHPERNSKGHWWHWMDENDGGKKNGWGDAYTTIGTAIFVSGAQFAKNHFIENELIGRLADEIAETTDLNSAIHPSLDGRVYLATDANGNPIGTLRPWNEYALVVSVALREAENDRAEAVAAKWLSAASAPKISYKGISTLTDNVNSFAPAFWVQQQYYLSADFASDADFIQYFHNQRDADALYCNSDLKQNYRYGLTAGVNPDGYAADRIRNHHSVFSPEAAVGWGDLEALLRFAEDQPPESDERFRYGLTRVSSKEPTWVPHDAALVDHLFLMFGLVESVDPLFFKRRQPFQADGDRDGIADAYDNCPDAWNQRQDDLDGDGIGDACACNLPPADVDGDADVDLLDLARWQAVPRGNRLPEGWLCIDRDGDHRLSAADIDGLAECMTGGPDIPADVNCGQ